MSPIATLIIRLVNRNLQLTVLAGAVLFAVLAQVPALAADLRALAMVDLCKLLVLAGLPAMLVVMGGAARDRVERVMARGTATLVCMIILAHTVLVGSAAVLLILALSTAAMGQVAWMRRTDERNQACT